MLKPPGRRAPVLARGDGEDLERLELALGLSRAKRLREASEPVARLRMRPIFVMLLIFRTVRAGAAFLITRRSRETECVRLRRHVTVRVTPG
jgi:hypothetical protein